ncbi:GFA family protein [Hoeflea sp. CAU 1731]
MCAQSSEMHEGGCFCGAIRYSTLGKPDRVSMCSCEWCRKRTNSAFGISVYFPEDQIAVFGGSWKTFRLTSNARRWLETRFCGHCGVAGGTFDNPKFWYTPERYGFVRSKPNWLEVQDGLHVFQAMPGTPNE